MPPNTRSKSKQIEQDKKCVPQKRKSTVRDNNNLIPFNMNFKYDAAADIESRTRRLSHGSKIDFGNLKFPEERTVESSWKMMRKMAKVFGRQTNSEARFYAKELNIITTFWMKRETDAAAAAAQAAAAQAPTEQAPAAQAPTQQAAAAQAPTEQAPAAQAPTAQAPTATTNELAAVEGDPFIANDLDDDHDDDDNVKRLKT